MKKLISVVLALAMVLSLSAVAFAADTTTLYCAAPDGWTACYCYAWNSEGSNGWPGVPMTQGEDGIWSVEIDSAYTNVIFNNGSGTQSADLTMPTDENVQFNYVAGSWSTYGTEVETPVIEYVTLYCNVADWGTPNAYWWGSSVENAASWPGNAMTLVEGTVYSVSVPTDADAIIFNYDGSQTANLSLPTDGTNMWNGTAWDTYTVSDGEEGGETATSTAPEFLVVGDNAFEIANGDNTALTSTFTATEAGTVTINPTAMSTVNMGGMWEDVPAEYIGMQLGRMYALTVNGENCYEWPASVEVAAGDEVTVSLQSYMGNPAKLTVTVGFEAGGEGGGDVVEKEECVLSETLLVLGENTLTLNSDAIFTVFEFCPDEAGVYKFTVNNAMASVGYSGGSSFYFFAPEGDLINSFEHELENVGPSIMVGISDVEGEFTLTIEKVGDAVVKEVVWVDYENYELEGVADFEFDGEVIALDVTDPDLIDKIFMDIDGLFRYGSPTGPVIVSMVNDNAYINFASLLNNGAMRLPEFDEEGDLIGGYDFSNAMWEYVDAGNVPMTIELMMMLASYGANQGWYDEDVLGFYLFDEEVDPETAYLCFFGYAEGTEMEKDALGTVIEGSDEFADLDSAIEGSYVVIVPEADGVVTVDVTEVAPGYIIYVDGIGADGNYGDFPVREGDGPVQFSFDVEAGGLYYINFCTGAYFEEYEGYLYAEGSISYVVTYDDETGNPENPETPEDPETPEVNPGTSDYSVAGLVVAMMAATAGAVVISKKKEF